MPCLKFYSSFASDLFFFASLTFLSQSSHADELHEWMINSTSRQFIIVAHLIWAIAICFNEFGQFGDTKEAELQDLKDVLRQVWETRQRPEGGLRMIFVLVLDIFAVEDLIEVADLFGPVRRRRPTRHGLRLGVGERRLRDLRLKCACASAG